MTLPVSEVFGPVWQGEGPFTGKRCAFVRLGLCNLSCEWCDTPYTWDATRFELKFDELTAEQISGQLGSVRTVVISGGEPLMHQGKRAMAELVSKPYEWHVETNGTIDPNSVMRQHITHFTVSPKINTRDPLKKRIKPKVLGEFAEMSDRGQASFKFVCKDAADVVVVEDMMSELDVKPGAVWIMPEGVTADAVLNGARAIADETARCHYNLTLRQQVLMYGTERAR